MTADFDHALARRLEELRSEGLFRQLRRMESPQAVHAVIGGRRLLNFSSNDYLSLANHPALKAAAAAAIERFGAGSGASRLISGSLSPHHELEEALAAFKGTEAAVTFSTGYAAALGTVCALMGGSDVIILDKLVHASIVDAARLSGAKLRIFAHNDLEDLEGILKWAEARAANPKPETRNARPRILVVTESVFSMDGDLAPLRDIVELKDRHGAWLMLDEAHATGLFGEKGRGLAEESGISDRIEVQMGTLGKALGASGGYICGSRVLVDFLVNRARSFIFSTAPVPAASAAATAAVQLLQTAEGQRLRDHLWARVDQIKTGLIRSGWKLGAIRSAIIPLVLGAEERAVGAADLLRERGVFVPAVRFPAVARGQARLRATLTAAHTAADVDRLLEALGTLNLEPLTLKS